MGGSQFTSGTTGAVMIAAARYDYNETGSGFIIDAEWVQWLNDGSADIAKKTLCLEAIETVTLVANQVDYTLTTEFIKVVAVRYVNASSVERGLVLGHPIEVGNIENRGEPDKYYEFADYIGIYPVLSSITTETAKVFLAYYPTVITSSGTIQTPAIYDTALKKYILAQAAYKDKKYATYQGLMQEYNMELMSSRQDFGIEKEKQKNE